MKPPLPPPGNCALQPGDGRTISTAQLRMPGVNGLTIRYRRNTPVSFIDGCVDRCRQTVDGYTLLCMSGESTTPWLGANVMAYENFAAYMGSCYAKDPLCRGVHVSGCTPQGVSEEPHWEITPEIEAANKRLITAWSAAFPTQSVLLAVAGDDQDGMHRLINHGIKVAPGRLIVKNNALKANTNVNAPHNKLLVYAAQRGAMIGWEMAGSTLESRFGGTWDQAMAKAAAIEKLADRTRSYLGVYPPDLGKLK